MRPQDVVQYKKAGRGFLIVRNSATIADTDYELVAREIVRKLNGFPQLVEALKSFLRAPSIGSSGPGSITIEVQSFNRKSAEALLRELGEMK